MGDKRETVDVKDGKVDISSKLKTNFYWRNWKIAAAIGVAMKIAPLP